MRQNIEKEVRKKLRKKEEKNAFLSTLLEENVHRR